ncbi:hypothetical protein EDB85DRAFT_650307 [Lactarius pseudohatsudake]|nr:hypothetical protein EDB85DRAFT_650307 [Lactarius pseudohatsudake]
MVMISVGLFFSGASLRVSRFTRVDQPERLHRTGIPRTIGYMFFSFSRGAGTSCIGSHRRMFQGEPDDEDGTESQYRGCARVSERWRDNADDEGSMRARFGETKGGQVRDSEVPGDPCLVLSFFSISHAAVKCDIRHVLGPLSAGPLVFTHTTARTFPDRAL